MWNKIGIFAMSRHGVAVSMYEMKGWDFEMFENHCRPIGCNHQRVFL